MVKLTLTTKSACILTSLTGIAATSPNLSPEEPEEGSSRRSRRAKKVDYLRFGTLGTGSLLDHELLDPELEEELEVQKPPPPKGRKKQAAANPVVPVDSKTQKTQRKQKRAYKRAVKGVQGRSARLIELEAKLAPLSLPDHNLATADTPSTPTTDRKSTRLNSSHT